MRTTGIKNLFHFIEYLHSNIDNFNKYNGLIKELEQLAIKRKKFKPNDNYNDKIKYDKIQAELKPKFKELQDNTTNLIKAKAKELNVCNFDNEPDYSFNGIEKEIHYFKENFSNKDLPEIFKHKKQYLEYRKNTHKTFLSLQLFFNELDEITKSLFDFFKDTEQNEFESFETKAIQIDSIKEVMQGFKKGQTKFILPDSAFKPANVQQQQIELLPPPQTTKQNVKLSDLITHEKSAEIVEAIKIQYKNIKGKRLKLLLLTLQELDLLPKERKSKAFHTACDSEFDWDIASYNAMNGYSYNENTDKEELQGMNDFLQKQIKTN